MTTTRDEMSVHEAMVEMGEQSDPIREALRRMIAEFGDQHYHTCPADNDSGPCACFAGALTVNAIAALRSPPIQGREAVAILVMNVRRRIHGLDDLDLPTLRRIKRDAGINEAFAIADAILALSPPAGNSGREAALKLAIQHIEHMSAFITKANSDYHCGTYSFESLGEDMPGIKAALSTQAPPADTFTTFLMQWTSPESRPVIDVAREMVREWEARSAVSRADLGGGAA